MYRVFGFLKRDGLSMPEFRDYYENHHVPLLLSRAPKPPIHKRRYVNRDEEFIRLLDRARPRFIPRLRKNLAEALLSWPSRSAMRRIARARVRGIAPPDCISSAACTSIILAALLDGASRLFQRIAIGIGESRTSIVAFIRVAQANDWDAQPARQSGR